LLKLSPRGACARSGPCRSPCPGASGARARSSCVQQSLHWCFWRPCSQWLRSTFPALAPLPPLPIPLPLLVPVLLAVVVLLVLLPRCALVVFIRHAVHSSPTFVPLCTAHRLHLSRSALIACIRHRGVVHSSPSFATLCTHRFHALAALCATHQLIAFIRHAVHSSLSCTRRAVRHSSAHRLHSPRCALIASIRQLCTHRLHSPRCALIASIRHAVRSSPSAPIRLAVHPLPWSAWGHIAHILSRCL
jgi:hypothetical protein